MSLPRGYDRWLLLGEKRNEVLDLTEVEGYGRDSFGDPDFVSIYGLKPADWYARGVRLLGRTAVECTRDVLAAAIAEDVARWLPQPQQPILLLDPFAGSANTLYWLQRRLPGSQAVGFELEPTIFELTQRNLSLLETPLELRNADYRDGLAEL